MTFPEHLGAILDHYGVPAATRAALFDLYRMFGPAALEAFADLVDETGIVPGEADPEDLQPIRAMVIAGYLRRFHPQWLEGTPTPALFHPTVGEGRGAGLVTPLGDFDETGEGFAASAARAARFVVGDDQPLPPGVLTVTINGHYGGRSGTVSFDVVEGNAERAEALALAEGRQHTLPGSAGETSGTWEGTRALLWEIQPNVLKPDGERNRSIAAPFRRHRNWHVATLTAALLWLKGRCPEIWILRGDALATTHEVNPHRPVAPEIPALHDRTVSRVTAALGMRLGVPGPEDAAALLESSLMNTALGAAVERDGPAPYLWRLLFGEERADA